MTIPGRLRRGFVTAGVAGSLVLGAVTVRAAAEWTAASAPLTVAPESVDSLRARLAAEHDRTLALQAQLGQLRTDAQGLATALDAASTRITDDTTLATSLEQRLAAAQTRLKALERSIAQADAAARARAAQAAAPRPASTSSTHESEDEEHDDG
jgi:peptidoglycan hydrolase CwlO-like protein